MTRNGLSCFFAVCLILGIAGIAASQTVNGVDHWVSNGKITLYVWEKYVGSPAGKPVVVLAHGSATAGRESFDLQVPGKPTYSLMDVLSQERFRRLLSRRQGVRRLNAA